MVGFYTQKDCPVDGTVSGPARWSPVSWEALSHAVTLCVLVLICFTCYIWCKNSTTETVPCVLKNWPMLLKDLYWSLLEQFIAAVLCMTALPCWCQLLRWIGENWLMCEDRLVTWISNCDSVRSNTSSGAMQQHRVRRRQKWIILYKLSAIRSLVCHILCTSADSIETIFVFSWCLLKVIYVYFPVSVG